MTDITNRNLKTILQETGRSMHVVFLIGVWFYIIEPGSTDNATDLPGETMFFLAGAGDGEKNAKRKKVDALQYVWRADNAGDRECGGLRPDNAHLHPLSQG